jgi:hypothetical protein
MRAALALKSTGPHCPSSGITDTQRCALPEATADLCRKTTIAYSNDLRVEIVGVR